MKMKQEYYKQNLVLLNLNPIKKEKIIMNYCHLKTAFEIVETGLAI